MADIAFIERELAVTREALAGVQRAIALLEQSGEFTGDLRAQERQYQQQIDSLLQQLSAARSTVPRESSGETVQQAQQANDDRADTQAPNPSPQVLAPDGRLTPPPAAVPSNAASTESAPTTGTNAPTRTAQNLQSTPAATAQTPITPGAATGVSPTIERGAAAAGDDNTNAVVNRINTIFGGTQAVITPAPNVLDRVASYTYNFSIYLSTPTQYLTLRQEGTPNLEGANLLMQSGGAPTGKRNQEFPLDFYIDDVSIRSEIPGKGSGGAHNAVSLSFRVYEPMGVTFLDRLAQATRKFVRNQGQNTQTNNYAAQMYLMVIRFWGYDINGELVRVANAVATPGASQEPGLIVEKYIPFRFQQIKFRLSGKTAQYDCRAVTPRDYAAPSQTRGIIPYNIELTSITLKDLLGTDLAFGTANQVKDTQGRESSTAAGQSGPSEAFARGSDQSSAETARLRRQNAQNGTSGNTQSGVYRARQYEAANARRGDPTGLAAGESTNTPALGVPNTGATVTAGNSPTQNTAPPKATAAPRPTLIRGLTAALNQFQQELVQRKNVQYPDIYSIVLSESVIADATLQPPEATAGLRSVPMTSAQTAGAQKLGIKQAVNREFKNVAAVAGMSIIQFLDQVVRNSSYIFEQQTKIWEKDAAGNWVVKPRGTNGNTFAWYRIGMDARPQPDKFDEIRGDYAYFITYTITPYQVNDVKSNWFPQSKFNGTHKKYEYWFTGLNTQIIDYEQAYDYLYYVTVNGGQGVPSTISDYREYTQYAFQPRAPEASQGAAGPVFDPAAGAAGVLYSPGDTAKIKMSIVGDPSYIQQGEILTGIKDYAENLYGAFLPDGTINYDSREVLFEVTFNTASDYNLDTGLMDVKRRAR